MLHSTLGLGSSFAVLVLALHAWGAELRPNPPLTWPKVAAHYDCPGSTISVELMGAESDKWMLAVEGNQTGSSVVAEAVTHEPYAVVRQGRNPYAAMLGLLSDAGPCRLVLNTGLAAGRRALLHLQVPTSTSTVEVLRSGRTEVRMAVGTGVLLSEQGTVTLAGGRHVLQAYALAASASQQPTGDLAQDGRGRYVVTMDGWKSHVIPTGSLPFMSESGSRCCATPPAIVHAHCMINEQGSMLSWNIAGGTPDVQSRLSGLLKDMTFKPFQVQGKAVAAYGILPIGVSQDGFLFLAF